MVDTLITDQTYAVPFEPASLLLFTSIVDGVEGTITDVRSQHSPQNRITTNEYHVRVRGVSKVHSTILADYEWVGPHLTASAECLTCGGDIEREGPGYPWLHSRIDDGSHEAKPKMP